MLKNYIEKYIEHLSICIVLKLWNKFALLIIDAHYKYLLNCKHLLIKLNI